MAQSINISPASLDMRIRSNTWNADRLLNSIRRYRAYRRSIAEMNACSDRVLTDLGIRRCDIRNRARKSVYGTAQ